MDKYHETTPPTRLKSAVMGGKKAEKKPAEKPTISQALSDLRNAPKVEVLYLSAQGVKGLLNLGALSTEISASSKGHILNGVEAVPVIILTPELQEVLRLVYSEAPEEIERADSCSLSKAESDEMYNNFQEIKGYEQFMDVHDVKFYRDILRRTAPIFWTWGDFRRTRDLTLRVCAAIESYHNKL